MIVALLMAHGLLAALLLGALTHQCIAAWAPSGGRSRGASALGAFRRVRPELYTNMVVTLYVVTFVLGALIYPTFRVHVRSYFDVELGAATGGFEIKEHFAALGLGLLPAYWYYWRAGDARSRSTARILGTIITVISWLGFVVGHLLNNIKGLA